jgi:hypothetical protein
MGLKGGSTMPITETEKFEDEMAEAGFEVFHYHGRFFWHGPAVVTSDPQAVIRATTVRVQQDSMGMGAVIYPLLSEPNWDTCQRSTEGGTE